MEMEMLIVQRRWAAVTAGSFTQLWAC